MHNFVPGQRWINNAELQLGLGTVVSVEQRTTTILFQASGQTRNYSINTAPLTRVIFAEGDVIRDHEGRQITIESIEESDGLLTYAGRDDQDNPVRIAEPHIDNLTQLNRPKDRLFTGQIDDNKWFALRYQTLQALNHISHSSLIGLTGCRTDLIPHQLYIADEVARRHAPRVLLADEVGLGKTIEAGMIIHQQLFSGQIQRVLIIVPENLLYQWLVEMLRRFNLRFSLFDHERYDAMILSADDANPFHNEQLVLCSLDSLVNNPQYFDDVLHGEWDMLVVDEAHHLHWQPDHASDEYRLVEQLAAITRGVLLLTATPEQLGKAGHYARLRILDPARFPDFHRFIEEEKSYEPVARAVDNLFNTDTPDQETVDTLGRLLGDDMPPTLHVTDLEQETRDQLITKLLDRHGTGRVLFRNTRQTIKGFPERQPLPAPLPPPLEYLSLEIKNSESPQWLLSPEIAWQATREEPATHWTRIDPRLDWLKKQLLAIRPEKVLVITSSRQTAMEIAEVLRLKAGILAAAFHEGLSIIERDRAAAYFADTEAGAQVLICSEIGSEGRNFQFAHHLVLFDLPLNPDLLEQRIGRLDRIGQKYPVKIHVPFLEGTPQALMYHWYDQGLKAFNRPCHTGAAVFDQVRQELLAALRHMNSDPAELIQRSAGIHTGLNEALEKGRDRLLEYNSCRPGVADRLLQSAREEDQTSNLPGYMDKVFDSFGVHSEEHSAGSLILSPAENMLTAFPHLPEDGLTVTFSREVALANEDRQFLTWSHPMVIGAMDMILSNEPGNTAVAAFTHPQYTPGTLLVECNYLIDSASSHGLEISKHLPPTLLRIVIDERGANHATVLQQELVENSLALIDRQTAKKIIKLKQTEIKQQLDKSNTLASRLTPALVSGLRREAVSTLESEINRLRELARVNPNIRREEIEYFEHRLLQTGKMLDSALPRLDAVRILVAA